MLCTTLKNINTKKSLDFGANFVPDDEDID